MPTIVRRHFLQWNYLSYMNKSGLAKGDAGEVTLEEIRALGDLGLSVEGYQRLIMYLKIHNQPEAERLQQTPRIVFEVKAIAESLNEHQKLPEKYKHLVNKYSGFHGVDLESEKFSF